MYAEAQLVERLRLTCGVSNVLTSAGELAAYGVPEAVAVVLPGSVREVGAVVGACSGARVRYVPRGAGTTAAVQAPVVIALTRLRTIHSVDLEDGRVEVDPGVPVAVLRRALAPLRTLLPQLPAPGSATVGGVLAAGYGRGAVLALDIVGDDGLLAQIDASAPGYDLCGDLVGSGGRRGVIVRATLALASGSAQQSGPAAAPEVQFV